MEMDFQRAIMTLMDIDLWLLIRAGEFSRKFLNLMKWTLEIIIIIAVAIGLLFIYVRPHWRFELLSDHEYNSEPMKSPTYNPMGITDASKCAQSPEIEREINHLKYKALSLEMAFRRMDSKLRNLHVHESFKVEELPDFAAEAAGGTVLDTPNTESYVKDAGLTIFGIPLCRPNFFTPRKVIQPWSEAGECWAFRGTRGSVKIELAYPAIIEQVALEHVSSAASLIGNIDSAPREFRIIAHKGEISVTIGVFVYNENGPSSQIFRLTDPRLTDTPIKIVTLEILSNWGNPNYTCIYRFKIHGRISM